MVGRYLTLFCPILFLAFLAAAAGEEPKQPGPGPGEIHQLEPITVRAAPLITPPAFKAVKKPEYPILARRRGWQGTAVLALLIRPDGTVGQATVQKRSGTAILDEAALSAAKDWTFTPAERGPEPIEMWIEVPVIFRLE